MNNEHRRFFGLLLAMVVLITTGAMPGCSREAETPPQASGPVEVTTSEVTSSEAAATENALSEQAQLVLAYADDPPEVRLGARLFNDNRMSNPRSNLAANCRTCHVPPEASNGELQYTNSRALSVIPANARGSKQETLRNTPTLLDVAAETSFNADGEFTSLEDLLVHKLTSTHMGWLPGEEDDVKNEIFALMLNDAGEDLLAEGSYLEQFNAVKGLDLLAMSPDAVFAKVIESLVDYLKAVQTHNTAAYDAMVYLNRFEEGLRGEEDVPQFLSGRIFGRIANQEDRVLIRFPNAYDEETYQGLKTFYRVIPTWGGATEGMEENIGNCLVCHIPPKFTDGKFHNVGVTQAEYDTTHGEGAFAGLSVASPSEATRARVDAGDASKADLGRWNVDPSDENFAAFKTPKLRFITQTGPYMHNGAYETLEDVIRQHIKASELAKAGTLRNADPELLVMDISERDIPQLVLFLKSLQEVPQEDYRDFRIENVRIRQDPLGERTWDN